MLPWPSPTNLPLLIVIFSYVTIIEDSIKRLVSCDGYERQITDNPSEDIQVALDTAAK